MVRFQSNHHERLLATKDENASDVERIASSATDSLIRPLAVSLIFKADSCTQGKKMNHRFHRWYRLRTEDNLKHLRNLW